MDVILLTDVEKVGLRGEVVSVARGYARNFLLPRSLAEPIKRIGRYEIPIELFQDVTVPVRTLVVPEGGELPPEAELPVPEEEEAAPVADAAVEADGDAAAESEAEDGELSDEALDEAIAAAEQPELSEAAAEEAAAEEQAEADTDDESPESG